MIVFFRNFNFFFLKIFRKFMCNAKSETIYVNLKESQIFLIIANIKFCMMFSRKLYIRGKQKFHTIFASPLTFVLQ